MTYSTDFRRKVLSIKAEEELTFEETAKRFGIGKTSLLRWSTRLEPKTTRYKPTTKIDMQALREDIKSYPDAYHYERAKRFNVSK
jgi:transposase